MPRLAIIGLGLIGGSLGLALKRERLDDLEIVGQDNEWGVVGRARKLGAIDRGARNAASAVEGAAIVVIATPISQVGKVMEAIAPAVGEGAVVTDTASTKRDVVRWADELLPREVSFVGGHPIAGKEQPGLDAAEATLFQDRAWAITPSVHASERAIKTLENLISVVGAHPVQIDAEEHDTYLAAVSHLPLLAATALFSLASESQAWPDLAALAGPGFRDMTRLASSSPGLSHDICLTNRENLLHWLDRFGEELRRFRALVADDEAQEELIKAFVKTSGDRDAFLEAPPSRAGPERDVESVSSGERMLGFMVGDYVMRRTKEIEEFIGRREGRDDEPRRKRKDR
jgi:prephenate dehydrogenase